MCGDKRVKNIKFAIDRGGTFTDCIAEVPVYDENGREVRKRFLTHKLLSEDPENYPDAPREGIRRLLTLATGIEHPKSELVDTTRISSIRMATTVATNALLERKGEKFALLITKGFREVLKIGNQSRPQIFDLSIDTPDSLYDEVIEVDERITPKQYKAGGIIRDKCFNSDLKYNVVLDRTKQPMAVLKELDEELLTKDLVRLKEKGIQNIAVSLLHSYAYPYHEQKIKNLAEGLGFRSVTLSSEISPMVKIIPRGNSSCVDAYLTPCIQRYITTFSQGFKGDLFKDVCVLFMQSDGGLSRVQHFYGFKSILSGPAGGVVGMAKTLPIKGSPVIGFDMGGTSTDVSRYDGSYHHIFETEISNIPIQVPQLDVRTVAAGGGSRLFFYNNMFIVGPESAGANPGPACYKKGGPLAVTDANLLLGRIVPETFPKVFGSQENESIDLERPRKLFEDLLKSSKASGMDLDQFIYGFVKVANESMCRPIREITQARGFDIKKHVLSCFGGAGGQHACAMARLLNISKVYVHKYSSLLSAYGLLHADEVVEMQEPHDVKLESAKDLQYLRSRSIEMSQIAENKLREHNGHDIEVMTMSFLNIRYEGTSTPVMTEWKQEKDIKKVFIENYEREFGFKLSDRALIVEDVRVRAVARNSWASEDLDSFEFESDQIQPDPIMKKSVYFEGGRRDTMVYDLRKNLGHGWSLSGPAILSDENSTILVEPGCHAKVSVGGSVLIDVGTESPKLETNESTCDSILLSVFSHRFMGIAEQMGRTLRRTSVSTNIKERLDFSCALFGPDGGLVANAPHIPVHLGSMQQAVKFQIKHLGSDIKEGDVIVSNHPMAGGSHLPDITVITPVFNDGKIVFFVASRGHHADIGGIAPGSMPPHSKELFEEGAKIKSFKLVKNGIFQEKEITKILVDEPSKYPGCSGSRNVEDNLSDLKAQVAANNRGIKLVKDLIGEFGLNVVLSYMHFIRVNASQGIRDLLIEKAKALGEILQAEDSMDDGTRISLVVTIDKQKGSAVFNFDGTGQQVFGNLNAPESVTYSAVIYCLRCMVKMDIPLNEGCLSNISIIIPQKSILSPDQVAAVVGGNVLTSQRVVDVILRAFKACAASQGCMNNLTYGMPANNVGEGGWGYYETIAGGSGAGETWKGKHGVHTHMTNTRITDTEILEDRYPVLLHEFTTRSGSGGIGLNHGGDGVVRTMEFLDNLQVSILSERRVFQPYGLMGGAPGRKGSNSYYRASSSSWLNLTGKNSLNISPGDILKIETPGGGGWGAVDKEHKP